MNLKENKRNRFFHEKLNKPTSDFPTCKSDNKLLYALDDLL